VKRGQLLRLHTLLGGVMLVDCEGQQQLQWVQPVKSHDGSAAPQCCYGKTLKDCILLLAGRFLYVHLLSTCQMHCQAAFRSLTCCMTVFRAETAWAPFSMILHSPTFLHKCDAVRRTPWSRRHIEASH